MHARHAHFRRLGKVAAVAVMERNAEAPPGARNEPVGIFSGSSVCDAR